jgi:hypothetical protein
VRFVASTLLFYGTVQCDSDEQLMVMGRGQIACSSVMYERVVLSVYSRQLVGYLSSKYIILYRKEALNAESKAKVTMAPELCSTVSIQPDYLRRNIGI